MIRVITEDMMRLIRNKIALFLNDGDVDSIYHRFKF